MFEKKYEFERKGVYYKIYDYPDGIYQLINYILSGQLNITSIYVYEVNDVSLGTVSGYYSVESFVENYQNIMANMSSVSFSLNEIGAQLVVDSNDNTISLISRNNSIEITDLLPNKKKTL